MPCEPRIRRHQRSGESVRFQRFAHQQGCDQSFLIIICGFDQGKTAERFVNKISGRIRVGQLRELSSPVRGALGWR